MSTNFEDLDPDSPEYEAALEAAQNAETDALEAEADAKKGEGEGNDEDDEEGKGAKTDTPADGEGQGTDPAAKAAADAAAAAAAAATAAGQGEGDGATEQPGTKVAGVLAKDGKTVLPYAALAGTRRAAQQHRARAEAVERENEALRKQLDDLKAGRKPEPKAADLEGLTEEELQELKTDFPAMAKVVDVALAALKRVTELEKSAAGKGGKTDPSDGKKTEDGAPEKDEEGDEVMEAIDANPALLGWMHDPEKAELFERAKVLDSALKTSPKWRDKPFAERFAHVTKLVADEFDIELQEGDTYRSTPAQKPRDTTTHTPSKADPKAAIAAAKREEPSTLSDFKGGNVDQTEQRLERMPARQMLDRMLDMSDADIDAHLARLGG